MENILVRQYVPQCDKTNTWVSSLEEALKILGKREEHISQKVDWLNYTDVYFKGTKDYIRIKNN